MEGNNKVDFKQFGCKFACWIKATYTMGQWDLWVLFIAVMEWVPFDSVIAVIF